MRQTTYFLIFVFVISSNLSFGQLTFFPNDISKTKSELPNNIKKITQYEGNNLMNVREFDTSKNLIFSYYRQYTGEYWNGKYITMITGYVLNKNEQITRDYYLHSNAGFFISIYEYNGPGKNYKTYRLENTYDQNDSLINTNPFAYISEIKGFEDLIKHKKISEIDSLAFKYLSSECNYDSIGNLISEVNYTEKGDTSSYQRYAYDENNNKIYFYNQWSKNSHWEYYYEYEKKYKLYDDKDEINREPEKLIQSVRINYDSKEDRKYIADIIFYKYDDKNRLVEELHYRKGTFGSEYKYEYNNHDQVICQLSYVHDPLKLAVEEKYSYNKEGYVIEHSEVDYRNGEKKENKYHYEFEFYK